MFKVIFKVLFLALFASLFFACSQESILYTKKEFMALGEEESSSTNNSSDDDYTVTEVQLASAFDCNYGSYKFSGSSGICKSSGGTFVSGAFLSLFLSNGNIIILHI